MRWDGGGPPPPTRQRAWPYAGAVPYARAALLVLLLTGSTLPAVAGVRVTLVAVVVAVPVVAYSLWRRPTAAAFAVPLFAVLAAPSLYLPPEDGYGEVKLLQFATFTLLSALAAAMVEDGGHVRALAWAWIAVAMVLAVATVVAWLKGWDVAGRPLAFGEAGSNTIWVGRVLATGAVFAAWLADRRPWVLVVMHALLGALYLTGSRAPMLGVAVALVALQATGRAGLRGVVTVAGVGVLGVTAVAWLAPTSRLGTLVLTPSRDASSGMRAAMWEQSVDLIRAHPWGVGVGGWEPPTTLRTYRYPHSLFLEVTTESGVLAGAILVGVLVWVCVRLARRARHHGPSRVVLAVLLAETVAVTSSGDLNARTFFALLTLGYCVTATWESRWRRAAPASVG